MTRVVHFSTKSYHKYLKPKIPTSNYTNGIKSKDRIQIESEVNSNFELCNI